VVPSVNRRMTVSHSRDQPSISERIEARLAAARATTLAEEDDMPASSVAPSSAASSPAPSTMSSLPVDRQSPVQTGTGSVMGDLPFEESAML
jgi:hypothetical protein